MITSQEGRHDSDNLEAGGVRSALVQGRDYQAALFGRLRDLRAHTQSLRRIAVELQSRAQQLADPNMRKVELLAAFVESKRLVQYDRLQIETRLSEVCRLLAADDKLYSDWGDVTAQIAASWEAAVGTWPDAVDVEGLPHRVARVIEALDAVIYGCGLITIPGRIRSHLKLLPIGGALDFGSAYSDELEGSDERHRFLTYLNQYPGFVDGLVEAENERILRADPRQWRRKMSVVYTVAIALAGFGLIYAAYGLGQATHLADWPFRPDRLQNLLYAYAFLLLGALAHVTVNLLKQDRAASRSAQALPNWILRIHVRESSFFVSALALCLGPIAMGFLFASLDWKTAFFVGYSYDSFVDLFLQRFEGAVPTVADLEKTRSTQEKGKT